MKLQVHGVTIVDDFLPLNLGSADIILGVQWLEKLGIVQTNWKTQVMKFQAGDHFVTLIGDPSLGRSLVSSKTMIKTIKWEGAEVLIELNRMEATHEKQPTVPHFLQQTVRKFDAVFDLPAGYHRLEAMNT